MGDLLTTLACNNFSYFARLILKQKVGQIHQDWLSALDGYEHVCIMAARGHFKTSIMSVAYPLWEMYRHSQPQVILITSATREQASRILSLVKRQIEDNPLLKEVLYPDNIYTTKWSETQLRTKNGHHLYSMPINDSIRGIHADKIISDDVLRAEVSTDVEDVKRVFYGTVFPTSAARKGKHIVVGTPVSYTDLLHELSRKESFITIKSPAVILDSRSGKWLRPTFPEHYDMDSLREIYNTIPRHLWAREYMCEPLTDESSMFPSELIVRARKVHDELLEVYQTPELPRIRVIGADISVSRNSDSDWSVFTVLEKIEGYPPVIVDIVRGHFDTEENIRQLEQLCEVWNPSQILVERTGVGWGTAEGVEKNDLMRGVAVSFDTKKKSRERILSRLEVSLRNNMVPGKSKDGLALPEHDALLSELSTFGYKKDKRTGITTYASLGAHDDCVMSLSLALEALDNAKPISITFV